MLMHRDLKEIAAISAVKLIKDEQVVGLGTGSTVYYVIKEISNRIYEDELKVLCIPTSIKTQLLAIENKIPLTSLYEYQEIDISIDGADEVDKHLNLIKGGGAAHTREKIVASCSKKFVVVVDESKLSENLSKPVPVEALPFSWGVVKERLKYLKGIAELRISKEKAGPVITDNGNFILDVSFGAIRNPKKLEGEINSIIGVIENGIFPGMTSEVHVGTKEGVKILRR